MAATDTRDRILARIREALRLAAPPRHRNSSATPVEGSIRPAPQEWLPAVPPDLEGRIALFEKNSMDLRTEIHRCTGEDAVTNKLRELAAEAGWTRIASHHFPLGDAAVASLALPITWTDQPYEIPALESSDAAITGCECLVAQTGSILVTARSAGGRAASVLPPHHVVIADRSQVVADLADAFSILRKSHDGEPPAFFSFITGPSRTGDIERILVLGAHGPKRLTVLLRDDPRNN